MTGQVGNVTERAARQGKIDWLMLVSSGAQESVGAAAGVSRASRLSRIDCGYRDAKRTLKTAEEDTR